MPSPKQNLSIYNQSVSKQQSEPKLYFPSISIEGKSEIQDYICRDFPEEELDEKFYSYDVVTVPSRELISKRKRYGCKDDKSYYNYQVSNIFCEGLIAATSISIIDKHLTISALQVLCNILVDHNNSGELFILSNLSEKNTRELQNIKKTLSPKNINFTIFHMHDGKFIHDRFVMLDDELWHFGGTVGGFQSNLTAYSRGWYNHGFQEFISDIKKHNYAGIFNLIKLEQ